MGKSTSKRILRLEAEAIRLRRRGKYRLARLKEQLAAAIRRLAWTEGSSGE